MTFCTSLYHVALAMTAQRISNSFPFSTQNLLECVLFLQMTPLTGTEIRCVPRCYALIVCWTRTSCSLGFEMQDALVLHIEIIFRSRKPLVEKVIHIASKICNSFPFELLDTFKLLTQLRNQLPSFEIRNSFRCEWFGV